MKPKLVICYNHFLPAFKAGGPIQSIANLIRNLDAEYEIYVISSNLDFKSVEPLNVKINVWQDFENGKAKVIYLSKENLSSSFVKKLITELNPYKIFVNGIYSIPFAIAPAFYFPTKTIMHVRGMLHPGALAQKTTKKKLFLTFFKLLGIQKKIHFCVSDEKEMEYAKAIFGENIRINIAQNLPASFDILPTIRKEIGCLNLISIALISPMKNHLLVLEALTKVKSKIVWHIYGPIKDKSYLENCQELILKLPINVKVNYMGEINPNIVYNSLANYHMFILPSQSENFGHALYEAMIAGKPIITSHNTPWNLLSEKSAGFNVDLTSESIANAIDKAASLNQTDYTNMVQSVHQYAEQAINRDEIKQQYLNLFNSVS